MKSTSSNSSGLNLLLSIIGWFWLLSWALLLALLDFAGGFWTAGEAWGLLGALELSVRGCFPVKGGYIFCILMTSLVVFS